MSQYWHGHWTNEAFKPVRLRNWEVPNWHPCWPDKHCKVTQFIADNQGRILVGQKRSTQSPWGYFKGTWQLPKKISRKEAYELSAPPQYKIDSWEQHKRANKSICKIGEGEKTVIKKKDYNPDDLSSKEIGAAEVSQELEPPPPSNSANVEANSPKITCQVHNTCQI